MQFIEYCTESKKQWLYGHRVIVDVLIIYPLDHVADWELCGPLLMHIASLESNENFKFEVVFTKYI